MITTIKSPVILRVERQSTDSCLWSHHVNHCCLKSPSCSSSKKFTSSHKFYLWFISVLFSHSRLAQRFVSYPITVLAKWHFFSGYKDFKRPIIKSTYDVDDNDDDDNNDNTIYVISHLIKWLLKSAMPVPVAARSKAWVCGRSLAGIVGSNLAGDMDVCLLRVLCVVR
jgi:hypothetical protein